MSERFYTSLEITLGTMELRGPEAHHLAVVSRIAPGSMIALFSGDGREFSAEVLEAKKNRVLLDVKSVAEVCREPKVKLTIFASIPKAQRCDFLIEKPTEIPKPIPLESKQDLGTNKGSTPLNYSSKTEPTERKKRSKLKTVLLDAVGFLGIILFVCAAALYLSSSFGWPMK